ncbi:MAG TPA: hypothetical protein VEK57_08875 [Thermoanaerobaculia bacterium]|nr:hypothetical protein [Thermoanaerobaculia bacterium]
MISCDSFRTRFHAGTEDAALLAHLRTCDRCLDFAANEDPDVMFRALGGEEMIPPGGVDAFVGGVMQQVRVRTAESTLGARKVVPWTRRLAVAATLAAGISGTMLFYRDGAPATVTPSPVQMARELVPVTSAKLTTKPVVETYESEKATIVEVPTEDTGDDVKIVMIFDENLPADL